LDGHKGHEILFYFLFNFVIFKVWQKHFKFLTILFPKLPKKKKAQNFPKAFITTVQKFANFFVQKN
jgi:hypothetical protein